MKRMYKKVKFQSMDGMSAYKRIAIALVLELPLLLMAPPNAGAQTTRYVNGTGVNSGNCSNPASPCATMLYALNTAAPGDIIEIGPGAYTERLTINKSITLRGSGHILPGGTVIQAHAQPGQATGRVITINEGHIVNISDLTIRHGRDVVGSHPWGKGGGIRSWGTTLNLKNVTFTGNRADLGGGLYVGSGSVRLENVIFTGNRADRTGGGMYNEYVASRLTDVVFEGNTSDMHGGGLYNSSFNLSNSPVLNGVTFSNNHALYAGGMYNVGASTLKDVIFTGNSAIQGGGMGTYTTAPSLTDVQFIENSASERGGGMYIWYNSPDLTRVTFIKNSAGSLGGGVSNHFNSGNLTDVEFIENTAVFAGGAMHNESQSSPGLNGVVFRENSAAYGGGMYNLRNCSPILTGVLFDRNSATQGGGGMYNESNTPLLTGVEFKSNTGQWGGGIYNLSSNLKLTNITFSENKANNSGGGLGNVNSSPTLTNVAFIGNEAVTNFGGAVWNVGKSSPQLRNVTIHNNHAGKNGGGIVSFHESTPVVYNSVIWGNTAGEDGNEIYNSTDGGDATIQLFYSLYGNTTGDVREGGGFSCNQCLTNDDPLFFNASSGDLRLSDGSPAIDAGDPDTNTSIFPLNGDEIPIDLSGNIRIHNGRIDMGAYEFQGSTTSLEEITELPTSVLLHQNYPNPFNPATEIGFSLPEHSLVFLEVFDITGRRISVLVDQFIPAGSHTVRFDASGLAGGVYLYRLQTSDNSLVRKMVLVK